MVTIYKYGNKGLATRYDDGFVPSVGDEVIIDGSHYIVRSRIINISNNTIQVNL